MFFLLECAKNVSQAAHSVQKVSSLCTYYIDIRLLVRFCFNSNSFGDGRSRTSGCLIVHWSGTLVSLGFLTSFPLKPSEGLCFPKLVTWCISTICYLGTSLYALLHTL